MRRVCDAAAAGCELAPAALGRRLHCRDSNTHLAAQFAAAAAVVEHIELNRWDLFHGHLLVTRHGHLGMLMHAQEFPQWCVPCVQLWRITSRHGANSKPGWVRALDRDFSHNK